MTERQREVFKRVLDVSRQGQHSWYRAADNGERVTLASLWRHGAVDRWPWRGRDGDPDAAYEYRVSALAWGMVT